MKVRSFAVAIVFFLLCGMAAAETYSIRLTYNSNLRASYRLDAQRVETAPAGTTLQVIGSHNRWLKIERNGQTLWMADWVAHTRLDEAPAGQDSASAQTPSDIDNCCFVDRHCQTDQEWTEGYWAYQNNQCGTARTSAPVASTIPYASREGLPPIYGDEDFINAVAAAFNYLRNEKPNWFDYVSIIDDVKLQRDRCGGSAVAIACAGWPYKVVYFTSWHMENDSSAPSIAATLVHEACHFYQWYGGRGDGYAHDPEGYEAECYAKEREAGF